MLQITASHRSVRSVPPSFEHGLVLLATLIRCGGVEHKIMDSSFMPKYGTVSQVLLQLVVASACLNGKL